MFFYFFALVNSFKHNFNVNDSITVYWKNIGSKDFKKPKFAFSNFNYFSLLPKKLVLSLNDLLFGDMKIIAPFEFHYQINEKNKLSYENILTKEDISKFDYLIRNDYFYVFYIDNMQKKVKIGEISENNSLIYSSFDFTIQTNQKNIIDIDISVINPIKLETGQKLSFYYSYKFVITSVKYKNRMDRYKERFFFESQLHDYSSSLNSIQCILYVILVSLICKKMLSDIDAHEKNLRTARDFDEFDLLSSSYENKGWRSLHADVFRIPKKHNILLYLISFGFFSMTFLSIYSLILLLLNSENNESFAFLISFLIGVFLCGVSLASYNNSFQGKEQKNMHLYTIVYPSMAIEIVLLLANLLFRSKSVQLLPFHLSIIIYLIIDIIIERLSYIGDNFAYKRKIYKITPSQVAIVQKMVPKLKWYFSTPFICLLSSFLIGSNILCEFYYIQTSIWIGKYYYTYMYLCISILSTFICSGFLSISITYFRLQKECHRWHWLSFLAPFSCSGLLFLYSFIFYFSNLIGIGFSSSLLYFLWSFIFSLLIGVGCGGSGYFATNLFIRLIYSNLKID